MIKCYKWPEVYILLGFLGVIVTIISVTVPIALCTVEIWPSYCRKIIHGWDNLKRKFWNRLKDFIVGKKENDNERFLKSRWKFSKPNFVNQFYMSTKISIKYPHQQPGHSAGRRPTHFRRLEWAVGKWRRCVANTSRRVLYFMIKSENGYIYYYLWYI